jgi:hypothetical protein
MGALYGLQGGLYRLIPYSLIGYDWIGLLPASGVLVAFLPMIGMASPA